LAEFSPQNKYFKNLDGLRTIGSLIIFIAHVEDVKRLNGETNIFKWFINLDIGSSAVSLFFVLSGFLITLGLLNEKKQTGEISIRKFYSRRILRLWPLYYFVCLITIVCLWRIEPFSSSLSTSGTSSHLVLAAGIFLFHLANFQMLVPGTYLGHVWSISVEEQFYLLWPILIKYAAKTGKAIVILFFSLIGFKIIFSLVVHFLHLQDSNEYIKVFTKVLYLSRFESLGLGGFIAYLWIYHPQRASFLFKKNFQIAVYVFAIIYLLTGRKIMLLDQVVLSMCFAVFILNLAYNENSIVNFREGIFTKSGKYSYGFYLWHPICIGLSFQLVSMMGHGFQITQHISFYIVSFIFTAIITMLSYKLIERPFLKLKKYSSKIKA
jgi:peptidoglycan/LPS O-acetylase OafA/YrhL